MRIETRLVPVVESLGASPLLQRVYAARGVQQPAQLERGLSNLLPPADLPDIEIAAQRLAAAVMANQKILIVGDFDADGATSVALCVRVLKALGAQQVDFAVPNRFDFGYGLSPEIVDFVAPREPNLIVTVDNGVSSVQGVARAAELGIEVIVTDHHLPGEELPAATAVVNPNLKDAKFASGNLAGVGVAYYVLSQVRRVLREQDWFVSKGIAEPNLAQYLDLVALGTVADVVPLDSNNRILVEQGLMRIRAGRCIPGIKAMLELAKRSAAKVSAQDIGFAVGPRLNAAGRLEDMSIGIKCLLAEDLASARHLATALDQLNRTRRALEQDMVADAELMLTRHAESADDAEPKSGICVYDTTFHQGVVGIVAGRLREKFHRPAIAFADAGDAAPDEVKGSARSVDGLHIRDVLDYIANQHPGLLIKFGGHAMAAGLSIKRVHVERFGVIFDKAVAKLANAEVLEAKRVVDGELLSAELTLDQAREIAAGGPWGSGFPEPEFVGEFELVNQRVVGEQHLKLVLRHELGLVDGIAFRTPPLPTGTQRVQVVYKLSENDFGQYPTLQLMVEYLAALP